MGRGGRVLWVESANVTAGGDPSIKINSYSHQGHDSMFIP